jgi:DNA-directed RNA polymerase II subunit RPB1
MSSHNEEWQKQYCAWMSEETSNSSNREPPLAEVIGVQFGILSSKEIKALSAVEITHAVTQKTGVVQRDGVTDSRLGTSQRDMLCGTCGCDHEACAVGHSGHIALALPVPNGEYLSMLNKILDSVCYNCCRFRLPKDFPSYDEIVNISNDKDRIKRIHTTCKRRTVCEMWLDTKHRRKINQRCKRHKTTFEVEELQLQHDNEKLRQQGKQVEEGVDVSHLSAEEIIAMGFGCGANQPYWIRDDGLILRPVFTLSEGDRNQFETTDSTWKAPVFTPRDMFRVLSHITDKDIDILGMNARYSRPESLMWENFYVSTVNIRPSKIGRSGNNRCPNEDDLTLRLKAIERNNCILKARIQKESRDLEGDSVVNLAKYAYQGKEFDTAEDAFAYATAVRPHGRPKKPVISKKTVTTFFLYDKLYRSITSYQNNKLKGKNITQYGKDKKSIRCRFKGQKKNRVRGSVMGKR